MKAARVLQFSSPIVIRNDDAPQPEPGVGQLLVRVKAAGMGNWDALIRETAQQHYGVRAAHFYAPARRSSHRPRDCWGCAAQQRQDRADHSRLTTKFVTDHRSHLSLDEGGHSHE
jgi:hypothetical protein